MKMKFNYVETVLVQRTYEVEIDEEKILEILEFNCDEAVLEKGPEAVAQWFSDGDIDWVVDFDLLDFGKLICEDNDQTYHQEVERLVVVED